MNRVKIQEIPIELLLEHPENSNFMNAETAQKLRRHIERTGKYEPLPQHWCGLSQNPPT